MTDKTPTENQTPSWKQLLITAACLIALGAGISGCNPSDDFNSNADRPQDRFEQLAKAQTPEEIASEINDVKSREAVLPHFDRYKSSWLNPVYDELTADSLRQISSDGYEIYDPSAPEDIKKLFNALLDSNGRPKKDLLADDNSQIIAIDLGLYPDSSQSVNRLLQPDQDGRRRIDGSDSFQTKQKMSMILNQLNGQVMDTLDINYDLRWAGGMRLVENDEYPLGYVDKDNRIIAMASPPDLSNISSTKWGQILAVTILEGLSDDNHPVTGVYWDGYGGVTTDEFNSTAMEVLPNQVSDYQDLDDLIEQFSEFAEKNVELDFHDGFSQNDLDQYTLINNPTTNNKNSKSTLYLNPHSPRIALRRALETVLEQEGWGRISFGDDFNAQFYRKKSNGLFARKIGYDRAPLRALMMTNERASRIRGCDQTTGDFDPPNSRFIVQRFCYPPDKSVESILADTQSTTIDSALVNDKIDHHLSYLKEMKQRITSGKIDGNMPIKTDENGTPIKPIFFYPTQSAMLSSYFGGRRTAYEYRKDAHDGLDFSGNYDDDILASAEGTVIQAGRYGSYGNTITIQHGPFYQTLYAHLSKIDVQVGDRVKAGQDIADMGNSGSYTRNGIRYSYPVHLHFEIKKAGQAIRKELNDHQMQLSIDHTRSVFDHQTREMRLEDFITQTYDRLYRVRYPALYEIFENIPETVSFIEDPGQSDYLNDSADIKLNLGEPNGQTNEIPRP